MSRKWAIFESTETAQNIRFQVKYVGDWQALVVRIVGKALLEMLANTDTWRSFDFEAPAPKSRKAFESARSGSIRQSPSTTFYVRDCANCFDIEVPPRGNQWRFTRDQPVETRTASTSKHRRDRPFGNSRLRECRSEPDRDVSKG